MTEDAPRWRRGRLLIATPKLGDSHFHRAVVLIIEHNAEGALGVILNRPTEDLSSEIVPGRIADAVAPGERVHEGGPVRPEAMIVLAEFEDAEDAAAIAFDSIGVVSPDADEGGLDADVAAIRVFCGYAGWDAGQLEREIEEDSWIDAACVPDDVFTRAPESLWSRVLERKGGRYRLVASMPEDPSLN